MDSSSPSDNNNQEAKPLSHVQRIRATVFNHTPPSLQQQPTTNRTSPPHLPARRETVKPTSLPQSHQNKSSPINSNATITVGANPPSENVNSAQVGETHTTPHTRNRMAALMNSSTTTPTNTTGHHSAPVVSRQHHRHQTIRPASHSPFSTNPPPATAATTASTTSSSTTTSSNTPPVTSRASNASDWRASIEAFRSGGSNGGLMDHLQQQFGHETTQPSNRFSMKVNNNNNNNNNAINNINNTTTTKTSCHQNDIESTAHLATASEKPLTIQVKLFETTDTITTVQCTDPDTSIRTFLQNLILNYIMKGANNNNTTNTNNNTNKNDVVNTSNENAVNQIMNMYSFLLVNQMAYHTNNRWIVDYDTPMRHLRQCGDHRSVLHFISKNKKVNVIVRSSSSDHSHHHGHNHHQNQLHTFSLSVPMDETWTVAQLTLEIAKKLAVKRPYDMDFGLRHFSLSVKSSGSGSSMIMSESASGVGGKSDNSNSSSGGNADDDDKNILLKNRYLNSPWLDMELSLREQGFDPASDYVVFSRRFFFYFDEMIQQSEMLFDLVSMTFFDARCKFLSGAIDMNVASQSQVASSSALLPLSSTLSSSETDTLSPELIDLIAVEALGAGINQSMLAKDKKLFKLLIPESKLKTYEANKLKIRKDIIQCVTTKSTKTNENMAQKKFIEAVSRDHLYKMDLYPATTKLPGTEGAAEVLIGVDTMAVYMIHRRNRNVLQQYDLDGITHFAGLKASFHLIAVVRGKQGRTEFDTEYGKQIENAVQCCIIAARSMRRRPPSAATAPTTTSSNNPINDFETMLKDGELVKKAQDELFDLERKMFNTGSLRDLCSTEVSTSLHPLPNTNNLELETMEKLIKNEAEVRCLSMYKNVIKGYLDATRVGTYNRSVPTMKSDLDQVILDIEQQQSNPDQHSIQRLKELVDSQYSSLVNYENYLHSKAELLLRKREDCIINNSQANNHLIRQNTPPKLVDKLRAHTILSK